MKTKQILLLLFNGLLISLLSCQPEKIHYQLKIIVRNM